MDHIQADRNLFEPPLPSDWFDLIVGMSTGGVVVLMLGRLRMSVDDAIEAYKGPVNEPLTPTPGPGSSGCIHLRSDPRSSLSASCFSIIDFYLVSLGVSCPRFEILSLVPATEAA
jgi:hypothetical protein